MRLFDIARAYFSLLLLSSRIVFHERIGFVRVVASDLSLLPDRIASHRFLRWKLFDLRA